MRKVIALVFDVCWIALLMWLGIWKLNVPITLGGFEQFFYYGILTFGVAVFALLWAVKADHDLGSWILILPAVALVVYVIGGAISSCEMFHALRECTGHGVRQYGQHFCHGGLLQPQCLHGRKQVQRRIPDQRPGRRRGGRCAHASGNHALGFAALGSVAGHLRKGTRRQISFARRIHARTL